MVAEKKALRELRCAVCGDLFRSETAQQCTVKQKDLELTRETARRHGWWHAINRDGTEVGWVCRACWKALAGSG